MKNIKLCSILSMLVFMISISAPIEGIRVHALNEFVENGVVYELQEDGSYAVIECNSSAEEIIIPPEVNGKPVTKIKSFNNFSGKEVVLSDAIKEIEDGAFSYKTSLSKITLPKSLEVIEGRAFAFCENLETVVIPDESTITKIGEYAFNFCLSLRRIRLRNGLKTIGEGAFSGSALEEINIPNTVTKIEEHAFWGCKSLEKVVLPENLEVIEAETFSNCCRLRKVELPKNLVSIGEAFCECNILESIKIPNKVNEISKNAFSGCPILKNITVSDENSNFTVLEDGSLFDNNKNEVVINIDKKGLKEKEKIADDVYKKLKSFIKPGITHEELNKNVTDFMQKRGDEETGGKPEVIEKEEFDKKVVGEKREVLYRGVVKKEYFENLKEESEAFFGNGNGQCGNGIYTTNNLSYAKNCSRGYGTGVFVKEKPFVMHMYLKDDAKIVSNSYIKTIKYIIQSKYLNDLEKEEFGEIALNDMNNNFSLVSNNGLIAYILGYDAINDLKRPGDIGFNNASNEMVVVNRSKLVICDE